MVQGVGGPAGPKEQVMIHAKKCVWRSWSWSILATRFRQLAAATPFPRGSHPGVSPPLQHQVATNIQRDGHFYTRFLPSIPRMLQPLTDEQRSG